MIVQPQTLAVFALAALAILAVPGPAVIYIVTRSIHQGRAAGLAKARLVQRPTKPRPGHPRPKPPATGPTPSPAPGPIATPGAGVAR